MASLGVGAFSKGSPTAILVVLSGCTVLAFVVLKLTEGRTARVPCRRKEMLQVLAPCFTEAAQFSRIVLNWERTFSRVLRQASTPRGEGSLESSR